MEVKFRVNTDLTDIKKLNTKYSILFSILVLDCILTLVFISLVRNSRTPLAVEKPAPTPTATQATPSGEILIGVQTRIMPTATMSGEILEGIYTSVMPTATQSADL